jgi:sodium transport system permease protein
VDLCAGEKERGTFETLLSSPALRNEIAIGKLLTVMTFSMVTSLLNLLSMGFTGIFVVSRLGAQMAQPGSFTPLGLPPASSLFWLVLALIPISALFSAVALAAASFAKSSKEGQYYLVPLMMISMPLMMLPMMPAAKLDLGSSLIPVSGLMLMLRGLIEGQHAEVLTYSGPVVAVTLICCWLAIRWVVVQFSRESVIFRPSERFSVNVWLKQVMRERTELPLAGHAVLCGVIILVVKFFVGLGAVPPESWLHFTKQTLIVLVAAVAMPAVLMAMFLTRNPLKSLKLAPCRIPVACAAVLAAILLHPAMTWLTNLVLAIYPPSGDLAGIQQIMNDVLADAPGFWAILGVLAVAPALAEELAFRGFILSGLQSLRSNIKAIIISSILFGAAHTILQQSIVTFFVGCVLGFIAVQTKSLIPCMLYHLPHNGLSISMAMLDQHIMSDYPLLQNLFHPAESAGFEYSVIPAGLMTLAGLALIGWFWKYREPPRTPQREFSPWSRLPWHIRRWRSKLK